MHPIVTDGSTYTKLHLHIIYMQVNIPKTLTALDALILSLSHTFFFFNGFNAEKPICPVCINLTKVTLPPNQPWMTGWATTTTNCGQHSRHATSREKFPKHRIISISIAYTNIRTKEYESNVNPMPWQKQHAWLHFLDTSLCHRRAQWRSQENLGVVSKNNNTCYKTQQY